MNTRKENLLLCSIYLYAFAIPFSAAGQHIVSGVASALLLSFLIINFKILNFSAAWKKMGFHFILMTALILCNALANYLNPHGLTHPLHFLGGYATLWILPLLMTLGTAISNNNVQRHMLVALALACIFLGIVALSQVFYPWKLSGLHLEKDFSRARAFYSHPLSFAYVCGILFAFYFTLVLHKKNILWLISTFCLAAGIYASNSKSIQIVVIFVSIFLIYRNLKRPKKLPILLTMLGLACLIFIVPNPFSQKFHNVLLHNPDLQSNYTDDRFAFWRVHWEMFTERPILGHGSYLTGEYRKPYYEKLGLGFMSKQYEAHNQYLQMAVEVGMTGLVIFLAWIYKWLKYFYKKSDYEAVAFLAAFSVLLIAGLTQNAFQDAVVRYTFTILLVFCSQMAGPKRTPQN